MSRPAQKLLIGVAIASLGAISLSSAASAFARGSFPGGGGFGGSFAAPATAENVDPLFSSNQIVEKRPIWPTKQCVRNPATGRVICTNTEW
jgi:hypothetical protein